MRFALMTEPQMGLTYADQLAVVRQAESAGFETFFRSDHYESFPGATDQPTTDAWAVLAGLARDTSRIGLGVLVSPVTFRTPGSLAKVAVTVDEMSGGRVEVGVGAGWHANEHQRHGFPFPPIGERADMLEETLEILRGLWEGPDGWSYRGEHYTIDDAFFRPKPASLPERDGRQIRILTGGQGSPRAYRIAARYADEFNLSSTSPDVATTKYATLDDACRAIGRDPSHGGALGDGRAAHRAHARRGEGSRAGGPRRVRGLGRGQRGMARRAPAAVDLRHAGRGPLSPSPVRRGRRPAAHAPGLPRPRPRHDRPRRRGTVRRRLTPGAVRSRGRPRPLPRGSRRGRCGGSDRGWCRAPRRPRG